MKMEALLHLHNMNQKTHEHRKAVNPGGICKSEVTSEISVKPVMPLDIRTILQ